MHKIKEILRLHHELGLTRREIGRSLSISHNTVADVIRRSEMARLSFSLAEELDETALDALLYPPTALSSTPRPEPDPEKMHRELTRTGVTLQLLWLEYKADHPDGLQYTQFCERYRRFRGQVDVVLRQVHKAGEKLFVDFAGPTVAIVDRRTGELREAHIFVAVLGCSNYTYTEATWGEDLKSWISAHVRCFSALGGVVRSLVCDNLKSGVTDADYYEPDVNPAYADLARHYGCSVDPARPRRPRDKGCASDYSWFEVSDMNSLRFTRRPPLGPPPSPPACGYCKRRSSSADCTISCLDVATASPVWGHRTTGRTVRALPAAHRVAALCHCRPPSGRTPPGPRSSPCRGRRPGARKPPPG
jgi:transposase